MKFTITVDLSGVAVQASKILEGAMPAVEYAVMKLGDEAMARWKTAIMHSSLWQGDKEPYVNSIQMEKVGPFTVRVFSDYKNAGEIEEGRPAFDQHAYLATSLKTRIVKTGRNKGKRYLIIPFRHNTPGNVAHASAMPAAVYEIARKMKKSAITGQRLENNVHGRLNAKGFIEQVVRNTYSWGGSLPAGLAPKANASNKTDRYAGMVRMQTSVGKKKSSAYMTFRTMMEGSGGWIRPAQPGLFLVQKVSQEIGAIAPQAITYAFTEAAKQALQGS